MIIQNATSGKTPLENSFVALDRQANRLGRCDVEPLMNEHLMPERPYELKLSVQGRPEARLQLYAAGIARAMALARAQSGVNARIYTECPVQNGALMEQLRSLAALVAAHPGTRFLGAHVASSAEDLTAVDALLEAHPNLAVDLSGRAAELGRQPRAAADLLRRHPGRVLWGSDSFGFDVEEVRTWFRLLETADEHFPYSTAPSPPQGRWAVSGLALEDAVLEQVYRGAARSWIPALAR